MALQEWFSSQSPTGSPGSGVHRIPPAIPEGNLDDDEPAPLTVPPFTVDGCEGTDPANGDILLSATTANGEKFTIRADLRHAGPMDGGSTTAPEEGDLADVDTASSSSDAPASQVGFWTGLTGVSFPPPGLPLRPPSSRMPACSLR